MWKKANTKNYGEKEEDEIICLSHSITFKFKTFSKMYLRKKRWKNMVKNVSHRKRKCIKLQILTTLTLKLEKIWWPQNITLCVLYTKNNPYCLANSLRNCTGQKKVESLMEHICIKICDSFYN